MRTLMNVAYLFGRLVQIHPDILRIFTVPRYRSFSYFIIFLSRFGYRHIHLPTHAPNFSSNSSSYCRRQDEILVCGFIKILFHNSSLFQETISVYLILFDQNSGLLFNLFALVFMYNIILFFYIFAFFIQLLPD